MRSTAMARKLEPLDLIRYVVGIVFLTEGILKFVHSQDLGAGRFAHIGLPWPGVLAPFVGSVEILGGLSLLLDLVTGYAALALFCVISTALLTTKLPVLLGRPLGPFTLMKAPYYGVLGFLHESRTDLSMFAGTIALIWRHWSCPKKRR
jgi:putative oxidoreductase